MVIVHQELAFLMCRPQVPPNRSVAFENVISKRCLARGTPDSSSLLSVAQRK